MNIVQFKILNRKCSFLIQLHPIESNWIQLNPKKSIRFLKYAFWKIRKKFQFILIHSRLLGGLQFIFLFLCLIILLHFANEIVITFQILFFIVLSFIQFDITTIIIIYNTIYNYQFCSKYNKNEYKNVINKFL